MRAVCIGECMVELRSAGGDAFLRSYAGDVYNTSVYLKNNSGSNLSLLDLRINMH